MAFFENGPSAPVEFGGLIHKLRHGSVLLVSSSSVDIQDMSALGFFLVRLMLKYYLDLFNGIRAAWRRPVDVKVCLTLTVYCLI
jgi:hypothetical protein